MGSSIDLCNTSLRWFWAKWPVNNTVRNVAAFCLSLEKSCFTFLMCSNQLGSGMHTPRRLLLPSYHFFRVSFQSLPPKSSHCISPCIISFYWIWCFGLPEIQLANVKTLIPLQMQFSAKCKHSCSSFSIFAITSLWHSYFEKGRVVSYKEPGIWSQAT